MGKAKGLDVWQGSITELPFEDGSFDIAITTQVLHHLEPPANRHTQTFDNVAQACREVCRVLKPGGMWMVSTQTPEQHVDGFWWAPLVPTAAATLAKNFPPLDQFRQLLHDAGFAAVETHIPTMPLVREDVYLSVDAPLSQEFRDADSTWALATPEELDEGLTWLQKTINAGEAGAFLVEREALRAKVGQTTTVIACKENFDYEALDASAFMYEKTKPQHFCILGGEQA